ncbi:GntR family transcriptional regulator [Devosia sp. RR2S18]|uniref:GntR family transcriptional regulator n=1 Tax=Devosia rhizosphaerae TaxID=3049774 RepID=UPI002540E377|nr:GntR family transcriptional regulator [Devosia sp. RR2S18]WIJ25179.1 GntR family transcriptional regulator [Devosia sp. RR2S18]
MDEFHASQPIFVQIRQRLTEMILRGAVKEGEALPSVRQTATELSVNPLTVTKAFEALVDIGVVEKRRGLGMFVKTGARAELLSHEREKFLKEDWPRIAAQIRALDLDLQSLLAQSGASPKEGPNS